MPPVPPVPRLLGRSVDRQGRPLDRRALLRAGGALLSVAALAPVLASCSREAEVPVTDAGSPLPIPPLLEPDADGRFALTAGRGTTEFLPDVATDTWGYNGQTYLGPTIRMQRGRPIEAVITNDTDEETTVHWHGMLVPAHADGGPHDPIQPGETRTVAFTPDQPAATLWYHPHPHEATAQQVRRGLAGMLILDDADGHTPGTVSGDSVPSAAEAPSPSAEVLAALPHGYGVDDLPVVIQDMRITEDGELLGHNFNSEVGLLGRTVVTNGVVGAVHTTDRRVLRLRLLNGSQARSYGLRLDSGAPLTVIGSDGGLLPEPVEVESISLSPAERAEVLVEVPDEGVTLMSSEPDLGNVADYEAVGGEDEFTILRLEHAGGGGADGSGGSVSADDSTGPASIADLGLPAQLAALPAPTDGGQERQMTLRGRQINGRSMDMGRIDLVSSSHQPEVWQVSNLDSSPHNFHIHNVQFRILDISGDPPPPEMAGWKDTIYTPPQRDVRIAVAFPAHEDDHSQLPYMYHCHLMLHEDDGMMGHFTVDVTEQEALDALQGTGHEH
ncbi:multicopper oxidase family protein [Brevibacterium yomogidense]|uniref:Multicopper oxidase CueO n=1 Tax=Brevibacterium yomogidense TaxID=946573 RepID=A0A1X6X9T0_9MICO|nr:multicopper oxidase domain-containing protein [Brevibacterium yomogidense]SLM95863.1 Multicopper oxidase [Brevibacterium yomogidense]